MLQLTRYRGTRRQDRAWACIPKHLVQFSLLNIATNLILIQDCKDCRRPSHDPSLQKSLPLRGPLYQHVIIWPISRLRRLKINLGQMVQILLSMPRGPLHGECGLGVSSNGLVVIWTNWRSARKLRKLHHSYRLLERRRELEKRW